MRKVFIIHHCYLIRVYRYLILLLFPILLFAIYSCNYSKPIIKINDVSGVVLLNKWQILGPFAISTDEGLLYDALGDFNLSETSVTYDQLNSIYSDSLLGFANNMVRYDNYLVDFTKHFNFSDSANAAMFTYAYCILKSDSDQTLMLNYASNSGSVIWLNNKLLLEEKYVIYKRFTYGQNYIPVNLLKGNNLLLIKVRNEGQNWSMFASIEEYSEIGQRRHTINSTIDNYGHILNSGFLETDTLNFGWWMPSDYFGDFRITGNGVDTTFFHNSRPNYLGVPFLGDGLYQLSLYKSNDTIVQHFYKGDLYNSFKDKLSMLTNMDLDSINMMNVEAYNFRYNHLMKPSNLPRESYEIADWKRKMVYLYKGLNAIFDNQLPNINCYYSAIDGSVQYYQLFVPDNWNNDNPLPLIIQLPVPVTRFNAYLETHHFADIIGSDLLSYVANRYNAVIIKANFRTIDRTNGNSIDEYDLWENIEAAKKICNIDSSRISLIGSCESAFYALRAGAKYPDKISAISLISPRLVSMQGNKNHWLLQQDPLDILENIWNVPLLNIHSRIDLHTDIRHSYRLNKKIKKIRFTNYEFREPLWDFEPFYTNEYIEELVAFNLKHSLLDRNLNKIKFSAYQLSNSSHYWFEVTDLVEYGKKINVNASVDNNTVVVNTTNVAGFNLKVNELPFDIKSNLKVIHNNETVFHGFVGDENLLEINSPKNRQVKNSIVEGPFAKVFLNPFIVVKGSIGSLDEVSLNNSIANNIADLWELRYDVRCRVMYDTDITDYEINNFNLFLIGNESSNKLIANQIDHLPIHNNGASISLNNNNSYSGNLSYYYIHPNPNNKSRYLAVLGYNNPKSFFLMSENSRSYLEDISYFGHFDYKIWTNNGEVLSNGFFNREWSF